MTPYIDVDIRDTDQYHTAYFVTPEFQPVRETPVIRKYGRLGRHTPALIAGALVVVVPLLVLIGTVTLHNIRTQPRNAISLVGREIRQGVLRPGEPVLHSIPVYQRSASDYFRRTIGELVMTGERVVYVGLVPRDVFAAGADPDVFERAAFATDTMTSLRATRAVLGTAPAVAIERDDDRVVLAVPRESWGAAEAMIAAVADRQSAERAEAERIEAERLAAEEAAKRPIYHTVVAGEALSTIATRYGITVERVQELNGMTDTKIRIGQQLLVKPDER